MKEKLKRIALRSLLLLASILAVTQAATAADVYLKSTFASDTFDNDGIKISSDNGIYVYKFPAPATKTYYFRYWDGQNSRNAGATDSDKQPLVMFGDNTVAETQNSWALSATQGVEYTITGENVTVSTVSGMPVASSAGRYDVAPGIYVAKAGGIPFKVIVK